jgi:hypothetical protein
MNGAQVKDLEGVVCDEVLTRHAHRRTDRQRAKFVKFTPRSYKIYRARALNRRTGHRTRTDCTVIIRYHTPLLYRRTDRCRENYVAGTPRPTTLSALQCSLLDPVFKQRTKCTALLEQCFGRISLEDVGGRVAGLQHVEGYQYGDDAK